MSEFIVHSVPGSPFGAPYWPHWKRSGRLTVCRRSRRLRLAYPSIWRGIRSAACRCSSLHGFMLYETQAILRYLDRVLPGVALTPTDPTAAAVMDQVMNISDWYLFQGVNNVIGFQRIVAPRLLGQSPDEAAITGAMPRAHSVFRELARLLGDKPYIAGGLSLADLHVAPQVDFIAATPEWEILAHRTGTWSPGSSGCGPGPVCRPRRGSASLHWPPPEPKGRNMPDIMHLIRICVSPECVYLALSRTRALLVDA